jgi:Fe2+ transport system protein FeoA
METGLDRLRPGMTAVVVRVDPEPGLRRRLRDFGMVPGPRISCRYRCPWGDMTALELRGSILALRTKDLSKIRVRC